MEQADRDKLRKYPTPKLFKDKMWEYFRDTENRPYLLQDLATHMGLTYNALAKYSKVKGYSTYYQMAKQMVEVDIAKSCLTNQYNAFFGKFVLMNMGWKDKVEFEGTVTSSVTIIDDIGSGGK